MNDRVILLHNKRGRSGGEEARTGSLDENDGYLGTNGLISVQSRSN